MTDGGTLAGWRIQQVEDAVKNKADRSELTVLADEVRSLRKTLIAFMATISGSAILFSFTMLQVLAHK